MMELIAEGQTDISVQNPILGEKLKKQNISELKLKILINFGITSTEEENATEIFTQIVQNRKQQDLSFQE